MERDFNNCQLIMIAELQTVIEPLKVQGKEYAEIREVVQEKTKDGHWLITDQRQRDECIAAALIAYGMNEEQRQAALEMKKLTGYIIV